MTRQQVTEKIIATKVEKELNWTDIARKVGRSKEWVTAGCLGQMTFTPEQAALLGEIFELSTAEQKWLTVPPSKAAPSPVQSDPLLYRLHEMLNVYGEAMKELIQEEFGDGIMSAIDFQMTIQREENPSGDRVKILLDGKFLPYKQF